MNNLKVTYGMVDAASLHLDAFVPDLTMQYAIEAALTHPDFRAQVAELMRGTVPDARDCLDEDATDADAHNRCRNETLARIAEWESAK